MDRSSLVKHPTALARRFMTPLLSKFSVSFSLALYPLRCKSLEKLIFLFFHSNLDKPLFLQPADYTVDVVEGQPAIVNMTAKANPSEVTYAWSREGSAIKAVGDAGVYDRITFNGALLNLTMVRRDDKGEYKCDATNNEGTQSGIVRLNVQCKRPIKSSNSIISVVKKKIIVIVPFSQIRPPFCRLAQLLW